MTFQHMTLLLTHDPRNLRRTCCRPYITFLTLSINPLTLSHLLLSGASLSTVIDTIRDVVAEQGAQGRGVTLTLLSTHPLTSHHPPPHTAGYSLRFSSVQFTQQ